MLGVVAVHQPAVRVGEREKARCGINRNNYFIALPLAVRPVFEVSRQGALVAPMQLRKLRAYQLLASGSTTCQQVGLRIAGRRSLQGLGCMMVCERTASTSAVKHLKPITIPNLTVVELHHARHLHLRLLGRIRCGWGHRTRYLNAFNSSVQSGWVVNVTGHSGKIPPVANDQLVCIPHGGGRRSAVADHQQRQDLCCKCYSCIQM